MIFELNKDNIIFPNPELADDDGLLAFGGDLSVERLLQAYINGNFPWYNPEEPVLWWCPKKRYVIFPDRIHISKSMKKYLRKHKIELVLNRDFHDTMHRCRMKREEEEGTWIGDDMEKAYLKLHHAGFAVSVEAYEDGELAGGLYGVSIGKCFFGESMFSDKENGSKTALILFSEILQEQNFLFIDCQFYTEHLESMGGQYISWKEYKELLRKGTGN
ncbi:MAG: leucyl/phenylalanyl-tRNA--protein transferase [Lachnospiraceae bacterium]|nr:leucyl/phenylalanyl-tRNA--protein transferase [Lachnospiraceae bacterium]